MPIKLTNWCTTNLKWRPEKLINSAKFAKNLTNPEDWATFLKKKSYKTYERRYNKYNFLKNVEI